MQSLGQHELVNDTAHQSQVVEKCGSLEKQSAYFDGSESNRGAQTGYNFGVININTLRSKRNAFGHQEEALSSSWSKTDEAEFLDSLEIWSDENLGSTVPRPLVNTCTWILERREFRTWLEPGGHSLLFITGDSGSGKSCLARFLANHFRESNADVVDFYCKNVHAKDDDRPLIPYLVHQLLHQDSRNFKHVFPKYKSRSLLAKAPSPGALSDIFNAILGARATTSDKSQLYFVIDGLDELHHNYVKEVLIQLDSIFSSESKLQNCPHIKFVILAQGTALIRGRAEAHLQLRMTVEDTKADIESYVQREMTRIARSRGYPEGLQQKVETLICDCAEGYFLWVVLVLADLEDVSKDISLRTIVRTIDECISDLSLRYANAIRRIRWLDIAFAEKLFMLVLGSFRALSLDALESALGLETGIRARELDLRGKILASCSDLLKIDKHDKVTLIHSSLQLFLTKRNEQEHLLLLQAKCSSKREVNSAIAKICLRYLSQPGISSLWDRTKDTSVAEVTRELKSEYPFFEYAAKYWASHIRNTNELDTDLLNLIQEFQTIKPRLNHKTEAKESDSQSGSYFEIASRLIFWTRKRANPSLMGKLLFLNQLAASDLAQVFKASNVFVKHAPDRANGRRDDFFTRLGRTFGAPVNIEKPLCTILIDEDVTEFDCTGRNPLHMAAMYGRSEMLSTLLECKVIDVNMRSQDNELGTALHYAAIIGNVDCLRTLLVHGADPNVRDCGGNTALHLIAMTPDRFSRREGLTLLLEHGADVEIMDYTGNRPLAYAMAQDDTDDTTLFLLRGSPKTLCYSERYSLLTFAARYNRKQLLKDIMPDNKSTINYKDGFGRTALHAAIKAQKLETVQFLLGHGADVNAVCESKHKKSKYTCLELAITYGQENIIDFLLGEGADPNARTHSGLTTLSHAVKAGTISVVKALLVAGAAVNGRDSDDGTALFLASSPRIDTRMIVELLNWGADVTLVDSKGWSALHVAAQSGNLTAIQQMLKDLATDDVDIRGGVHSSALYYACAEGHIDVVQALLDAGADANLRFSANPRTAIDIAVRQGHIEIVSLLLQYGADPLGGTLPEWSPFHESAYRGDTSLFLSLLGTIPPRDVLGMQTRSSTTPIMVACSYGHLSFVKNMIGLGADLLPEDSNGSNLIHLACESGNADLVRYLGGYLPIQQNLDIFTRTGVTALGLACRYGHADVVRYLIEEGANPSLVLSNGRTYLHIAVTNGHVDLCHFLLDRNIDVNKVDADGWGALHFAVDSRRDDENLEIVETLLQRGASVSIADFRRKDTPLILCRPRAGQTLQRLLRHSTAELCQQSVDGRTALHHALSRKEMLKAAAIATFAHTAPSVKASDLLDELLQLKDGLGRTPYDIVVAQYLSSEQAIWDLWTDRRSSMLVSISVSVLQIIENTYHSSNLDHVGSSLASWLIAVGDEAEAFFWLCRCTRFVNDMLVHFATCDACDDIIDTDRYLCRVCGDIDLCEPCMSKYVSGTLSDSPCRNHSFLKVGIKDLTTIDSEQDQGSASSNQAETTNKSNAKHEDASAGDSSTHSHEIFEIPLPNIGKHHPKSELRTRLDALHEKYSLLHKVFTECAERQARENALKPPRQLAPSIFRGRNLALMLWRPCRRVWRPSDISLSSVYGATEYRCRNGCPREEVD